LLRHAFILWDTLPFSTSFSTPPYNNKVYLDDYVLNDIEAIYKALKLTTNRENGMEIYSSYKQYSNGEAKIMIHQLEP